MAAAAAVGGFVVVGGMAAVQSLNEALGHNRKITLSVKNESGEDIEFLNSDMRTGCAWAEDIPDGKESTVCFYNNGSFSGSVQFKSSKGSYLRIGASNPLVGWNKLRVSFPCSEASTASFYSKMNSFGEINGKQSPEPQTVGRVRISAIIYDNPGSAKITLLA